MRRVLAATRSEMVPPATKSATAVVTRQTLVSASKWVSSKFAATVFNRGFAAVQPDTLCGAQETTSEAATGAWIGMPAGSVMSM